MCLNPLASHVSDLLQLFVTIKFFIVTLQMDTHKSLDLNDTLEFILYGGSDFEDIANSNSDFEPNDSTTENLAAVRKLGA